METLSGHIIGSIALSDFTAWIRCTSIRDRKSCRCVPQVHPRLELEREPDHWFWALEAITGESPVPESDAGDIEASALAWVEWGREKGLLAK